MISNNLILYLCCIIGILDTLYISYHASTGKPVKCWLFPKRWCNKVQYSSFSRTLGIPNGYLGLALYTAILVLTLLNVYATLPFWPIATLILIGFAFALYFTIIQAFVLRAFCVYCIISALNFTVLFISLFYR